MVRGETYYTKFSTGVSLVGYTGSWELYSGDKKVLSGTMTLGPMYFECSFDTSELVKGAYTLVCFITYPDGFIQNINNELIQLQ